MTELDLAQKGDRHAGCIHPLSQPFRYKLHVAVDQLQIAKGMRRLDEYRFPIVGVSPESGVQGSGAQRSMQLPATLVITRSG